MSIAELRENGFNVANTHTPICSVADYNIHETIEQHYERCYKVTQAILERHQHQGIQYHKISNDIYGICFLKCWCYALDILHNRLTATKVDANDLN